jgi:tetrahydromethanopterin S-methyltransferase subunit G
VTGEDDPQLQKIDALGRRIGRTIGYLLGGLLVAYLAATYIF